MDCEVFVVEQKPVLKYRMHRRAIISDIHGNLPALEAVLADIQTQNVDDIVCLGDICGYGPQPVECIERVRAAVGWTLLGNHDEAIYREPLNFSRNAYDAIVWQRNLLDPAKAHPQDVDAQTQVHDRWAWLKSLLPSRTEKNVRYVHASPRDPLHEYILKEDFDISSGGPTHLGTDIMADVEWLCFCGHSHRPGVVAEDYKWWLPENLPEHRSLIRPGFKTIVNVGSVGQPRDGIADACYVIFEFEPPKDAPAKAPEVPHPFKPTESTIIMTKKSMASTVIASNPNIASSSSDALEWNDEETRNEKDSELQQARDTIVQMSPKVFFRRVPYNIADAQARFFAIPELPRYNGIRLAMGK